MHDAGEDRLARFEHLSEEERKAMELRWDTGRMQGYVAKLPAFVDQNRHEILSRARDPAEARALLTATKLVLLDLGSLDHRDDMLTQRRRISDHVWISIERGARDPHRLADEWVVNYAAPWRVWRMKKYIHVINRCADAVVAQLREPPADQRQPAA
ncbi:MAG: hypothetical protein JNL39_05085 [Opitutaceae bacterium]|nr:hypothetical protein [Opitutaceae bacterium]